MATFGRLAKPGAGSAFPRDSHDSIRQHRKTIPFPTINETARSVAVQAKQEEGWPAVARQPAPDDTENGDAPIGSLKLHVILRCAGIVRVNIAREPHRFFDLAVQVILPRSTDMGFGADR
jgi:hypothetical protein